MAKLSIYNTIKKDIFKKIKTLYNLEKDKIQFSPGKSKVNCSGRVYDDKEIISLVDAALEFWLTSGRFTKEFEKRFCDFLKIKHTILVNSGSSANLLAVTVLTSPELGKRRILPGDEVITTAATFPTTVNPIVQNQLVPVFLDIELPTYNIAPQQLEKAITKKTKAIFIAHTLGNPLDIDGVTKIADKYNLFLIEDACDALGSKYKGKFVGTFGDIGTFSFYPAHHLSCSKDTPIPYLDKNRKWKLDRIEKIFQMYANKPDELKVISFNRNNKVEWSTPSAILRHKIGSKRIIRIISQHGREVEVTEDHSVFVLDKETAKIIPKFARDIKKDDYVVATNNISCPSEIKYIDILDCFRKKDAYVSDFPYSNLKYVKNSDYKWQFKSRRSLPVMYLKDYNLQTEHIKVGISQSKKILARIPINEELCRFIGYFLAEGSYQNGLVFSFNKNEKDLIEDIKHIVKILFDLTVSMAGIKETAVNIEVQSKNLEIVFKEIFGIEGHAYKKRIPWFIYHTNEDCISSFIYGYTRGDGSIRRMKDNTNRIDVTSVSKQLLNDFQYLLSRIGISASFYKRNTAKKRKIGKIWTVGNDNYSLCFSGYIYKDKSIVKKNTKDKNNVSLQIPLLPIFRKYICVGKKQKIISRSRLKQYLKSNKELYSLLTGDVSFLKVRSIKEISYDKDEYVYDISVPGKENFYGGFLGLFLHNTMGEGGALVSNNDKFKRLIQSFRDWGRACWCEPGKDNTCGKRFKYKLGRLPYGYDHKYIYSHLGYNLKITDLQSAIGVEQIKKLPDFIRIRKNNFNLLYKGLDKYQDYLILPEAMQHSEPSWFGFLISVKKNHRFNKNQLVEYLERNNIVTRMLFAGNITKQPAYKNVKYRIAGPLKNTDFVMHNTFWIGVYPGIDKEKIDYILDRFDNFFKTQV